MHSTIDERKSVAVDFDGVLHQWDGEWKGDHVIDGLPLEIQTTAGPMKALEWLHTILQEYNVDILTTRGGTFRAQMAILGWIKKHAPNLWEDTPTSRGLHQVRVTNIKKRALMYIDDRAFRFEGTNYPSINRIRGMRPWWKEPLRE